MSISQEKEIDYQKEEHAIRRAIILKAPLARVWQALATPEGLASWLMPNDFRPLVGASFTFNTPADENWDGVVRCQVTEIQELRRIAFTWSETPNLPPTLVTFELHDVGDQTEVCLIHSRRELLPQDYTSSLDKGWGCNMLRRLARIIEM
jgi:uncharacterized protein YndB with AHSA1/START domain